MIEFPPLANPIERGNRIAGGYPIQNIAETPWQVAIHMNGFFVCGGAIISNEWILTAASCIKLFTIAQFDVNIGSLHKFRDGLLIPAEKAIKRGKVFFGKNSDYQRIAIFDQTNFYLP